MRNGLKNHGLRLPCQGPKCTSRLCSLFPPHVWEFACLCSRSALLLGSRNQAQTAGKQLSCEKDLREASQEAGLQSRFSSSPRLGLACATLPVPGITSCRGGTCPAAANLPGGHQTAPDPNGCPQSRSALLLWVLEVPALPALLSPWVPAHLRIERATPAAP